MRWGGETGGLGPDRTVNTRVSILVFYSEKKREPVKGVIQLGSMGFAL